MISVASGANENLSPSKIESIFADFADASMIVMQYEIPESTIKLVLDKSNENNIPVLWNMAPAKDFDLSYIPKIDTLILNEIEAGFLSGVNVETDEDAELAAGILVKKGVKKVIVTLGANGVFARTETEIIRVPSFKVDAVDTTAAGDTFCGTLTVALVEQKSLKEALTFASAAAAISVTRLGAQPSAPTRVEIDNFLKTQK